MSHFTRIKTSLKDKDILKKALTHLGWEFQEGNFKITQYNTTEKAELKLSDAVGLSLQEDGTWTMVGDPYHDHGKLRKYYNNAGQFTKDLSSAYSVVEAKERLEEQNFYCVENDKAVVGPDGKIRMIFQSNSY